MYKWLDGLNTNKINQKKWGTNMKPGLQNLLLDCFHIKLDPLH